MAQDPSSVKKSRRIAHHNLNIPTTCPHGTQRSSECAQIGFLHAIHPNDILDRYPPLVPFEHYDHGKDADPSFPNLLKGAKVTDLTSNIGAEVHGIQLSSLDKAGKDELALFVAQKKVVGTFFRNLINSFSDSILISIIAFRDQDFADLPIQEALDFGGYFGRHHIHPTSGAPEGCKKTSSFLLFHQ